MEKQQALAVAAEMIAAARRRAAQWPLQNERFSPRRRGLGRAYQRGRRGLAQAVAQPSVERVPAWRKPGKGLWYQERFLKSRWPAMMGPCAEALQGAQGAN